MVESVIQIKKGITINVDTGVKIHKKSCVPKRLYLVRFGVLLDVVAKMTNI